MKAQLVVEGSAAALERADNKKVRSGNLLPPQVVGLLRE
jgi:hypothetical protein